MKRSLVVFFWAATIALCALRLAFISTTMVIDDEAYYTMYARHLAWGYIDHGPVIAGVIRPFVTFLGENPFGIRIVGTILITVLALVLYRFGKTRFSPETGFALSLLVTINFMTHLNSIVITPDTPLAFFMILAIMTYYKAFFEHPRHFWLAGVLLGLAMLSKISAAFPAFGIVLFPIVSKEHRVFLKEPLLYLSLLIAFVIFLPFVIWNFQHDFAFFRYQGSHVAGARGDIHDLLELWAGLALVSGPIFFYYGIIRPFRIVFRRQVAGEALMLFFGLITVVPAVYFFAQSTMSRLELTWPAPAFYSGIFLTGIVIGESWVRLRKLFWLQIAYSFALIAFSTAHTYVNMLPFDPRNDITDRYYDYGAFTTDLGGFLAVHPDEAQLRIVGNNYQIPSMVNLLQKPDEEAICLSIVYHETMYAFYYPDSTLVGDDFLYIGGGTLFPHEIRPYFDSFTPLDTLVSYRWGQPVSTYGVWRIENYKGKSR